MEGEEEEAGSTGLRMQAVCPEGSLSGLGLALSCMN